MFIDEYEVLSQEIEDHEWYDDIDYETIEDYENGED